MNQIEFSQDQIDCIVEYLLRELTIEALYALRNVLIMLRAMLETYALLYLVPSTDKLIEQLLMNLRFGKEIQTVVNQLSKTLNDIFRYMPGEQLTQCVGFTDALKRIQATSMMMLGVAATAASYMNRYTLASGIENYRDQILAEALGYIDALISIVDTAISYYGTR